MGSRRPLLVVAGMILGGVVFVLPAGADPGPPEPAPKPESKAAPGVSAPPESLRAYYPPASEKVEYTLGMLELGRLMGVAFQDLYSASPDAAASLEAFAASYGKIAALVPEWKGYFPDAPIADLDKAVESGAPAAEIKRLTHSLERVCTHCHANEMPKVQALFDWPAFDQVTAPVSAGGHVSFHEIMIQLSTLLAGIEASAEKKNFEQAAATYSALKDQFEHLEGACSNCHVEPREYFVDQRVKGRVSRLGGLARQKEGNPALYRKEVDAIYSASCIPCHHIHMPPAFIQMRLKEQSPP